jgi:hypothetical protein
VDDTRVVYRFPFWFSHLAVLSLRVFDCIILHDELDLLEARFRAYQDIPEVTHVICEATVDEKGNPKPLHFQENRDNRFLPYRGRWNHVTVEAHELSSGISYGSSLKNYLTHGINGEPGDIILQELDTIPPVKAIRDLAAGRLSTPGAMMLRWRIWKPQEVCA